MSFKFNFSNPENDRSGNISQTNLEECQVLVKEAEDVLVLKSHINSLPTLKTAFHVRSSGSKLMYVDSNEVLNSGHLTSKDITSVLESGSDLKPSVYEGGLKIWECCIDLLDVMETFSQQNMKVLEVGCGAGLPGIAALISGASKVDFLDYNREVLDLITIPNVLLNISETDRAEISAKCRFISGDWSRVSKHLAASPGQQDDRYDIILTSETIYNQSSYCSLLDIFKSTLKESGKIYVAAKSFYFGVGGGINQFQEAVKKDNVFTCEQIKIIPEGIPREVLLMQFKNR